MPRVKRGTTTHRRHKKILKLAKGYRGKRKNVFKLAKNAVMKAGMNAYRDRRLKKRTFHQLWILRINAACREHEIKYSRFIYGLELAGVQINRKMLSELATNHPEAFKEVVEAAKAALPPAGQAPDLEELKKRFAKAAKTTEKKPVAKKTEEEKSEKEVRGKARTPDENSGEKPKVAKKVAVKKKEEA